LIDLAVSEEKLTLNPPTQPAIFISGFLNLKVLPTLGPKTKVNTGLSSAPYRKRENQLSLN
jgi:hypothetical protein